MRVIRFLGMYLAASLSTPCRSSGTIFRNNVAVEESVKLRLKTVYSWKSVAFSAAVFLRFPSPPAGSWDRTLHLYPSCLIWCKRMLFPLMLSRKAHRWTENFCTMGSTALSANSGCKACGTSCSFVSFYSLRISKEHCSLGCEWELLNDKELRSLDIEREAGTVFSSSLLLSSVSTFLTGSYGN